MRNRAAAMPNARATGMAQFFDQQSGIAPA
jgi:hypothetical protein